MSGPSVTYTFANSTTSDATQVNQNFQDVINGMTDGLKDIAIGSLAVTNGISVGGAFARTAVSTVVATNGGSSTVANATATVILAPAGTIAAYGLTLPAAPAEGQEVSIYSNGNEITTLTIAANSGHSLATSGVYSFPGSRGASLTFVFRTLVWYQKGAVPISAVSRTVTTTATAVASDDIIEADATSAGFTITVPAITGKVLTIRKSDATFNVVTLSGTFDGVSGTTLNTQGETITLVYEAANSTWVTRSRYIPSFWSSSSVMTITASTSNPAKGSADYDTVRWRREGDSMRIRYAYAQTGAAGSAGSGFYIFAIPSGVAIDGSKTLTSITPLQVCGIGRVGLANGLYGTQSTECQPFARSTTTLGLLTTDSGDQTSNQVASGIYSLGNATLTYSFEALVAINGWKG